MIVYVLLIHWDVLGMAQTLEPDCLGLDPGSAAALLGDRGQVDFSVPHFPHL